MHLHAIEERAGDRLGHVPGRDEEDLREVELDVEVVVAERVVLRRVEHLEQRRGRVAAPVGADLVDLVEHDHRVHRPGVAQGADEPARERADVRAAMAADLGLVADAAERHADELASGRARDRLADRRLAGAGRADEREDRAGALVVLDAALLAELRDGDVLDDAVLHVVEARVVGVEHLARVLGIEPLLGALAPRDGEQPVEVVADHGRLGRLVAHALEPRELLVGLLEHVLGHLGLGDLRAVLLDDRALVLAELLADRVELAAQDVLALLLLDAGLDVLLDAPAHLHESEALALQLEGELEPLTHVDGLEQLHLLLEGQVGRVAGGVGERAGLGDRADEGGDAAVVAAQLEDLLDRCAVLALELADAAVGRLSVGPLLDLDEEASLRIGRRGAGNSTVQAVQRNCAPAAGKADPIGHLGDGADLRVLVLVLGHEQHALLVADVDGEGHVHVGEDDDVFQRDEEEAYRVLAHGSRFRADVKCRSWFRNCTDDGKCCVELSLRRGGTARSARVATRPASTSADTPTPRELHVITLATKTPPRQKTSPESWRASFTHPALCMTTTPGLPCANAIELRHVADVREEPEEVAAVGSGEARLLGAKRPAASRSEPDRA